MNQSISLATIHQLYNYNYWARDRQLQACAALTEEQLLRNLGSSFPSVRDTLAHMVAVEWVWLERWRGSSPRKMPDAAEFPDLTVITERWRTVEHGMREYLADLNEEDLDGPVTYISQKGDTFTFSLWQPLLHLLNHQSYHRGQVTAMLRQLGAQAPGVDFLLGCRTEFRPAT